jgi:periplasmic copper chaperone A
MNRIFAIFAAFFVTLSLTLAGCAAAPTSSGPDVKITNAYARAAAPNGAVYMELKNDGGAADTLVNAASDVAQAVELHESKMEGDVMKMRPVEKIEVPAGGSATLKPGGLHIMLIGLKKELAMGDKFNITLNFEKSGAKTIEVEVKDGMQMPADPMEGGQMNGDMNQSN